LEPENVNIRKIGGVPVDEGLEEELNKVSSRYRNYNPN